MARLHSLSVLGSFVTALVASATADASGVLVPRDGSAPIGIRSHRVNARVEDGIARTSVRQVFVNPHSRVLEAVYSFPLPEDAAIVELSMTVAGQRLEGLLAERREARRVYDSLVRKEKDPALLERIGRTEYRLSVFPVLPQVETVIELTYVEPTPVVAGELRYVYPLASRGPAAATEHDLTATIEFASSAPIVALESPTEGMTTTLLAAREGRASFEKTGAALDRDLVVVARIATPEPSLRVHSYRSPGGDAYFAAIVTAPSIAEGDVIPRDFTFVLDVSGSMAGDKIERARRSVAWWLEKLGPRDRANVVCFSDSVKSFTESPIDASADNRRAMADFVAGVTVSGGTDLHSAVTAAGKHRSDAGRIAVAVVLTDGRPTIGETSRLAILTRAREAGSAGVAIHTFGIGDDVDPVLLDGIASAAIGESQVLRSVGDVEERLRAFLNRIGAPAIRGSSIRIGDREAVETWPKAPFTVHRGEQLVVTGRCVEGGVVPISFHGVLGDAALTLRAMVDLGDPAGGTATGSLVARDLYAERRLAALERAHRLRLGLDDASYHAAVDAGRYDTQDELVAAMIDVSLETGVQCAYTSFLALLPEDRSRLNPRDPTALDAALKRVAERRRLLASSEAPPSEAAPAASEQGLEEELAKLDVGIAASPIAGGGSNDVLGVGGGSGGQFGGKYGKRGGGKGGGRASQSAVDLSLDWLKRHQSDSGAWSADRFVEHCEKDACSGVGDPALGVRVTSHATLAFLGAGNTPNTGKYKSTVKKAVKWLIDRQDVVTGEFLAASAHQDSRVDHALATLVLCEAYGLSKWPQLKEPALQGIARLLAWRVPGAGWRRAGVDSGEGDVATTVHALLALLSARDFGLDPDPLAIAEAHEWLKSRSAPQSARETAGILFARTLLGDDPADPSVRALTDSVHAAADEQWKDPETIDLEFAYFASYSLYRVGGRDWDRMQERLVTGIVKRQAPSADERGSFSPPPTRSPSNGGDGERAGGRVESTALAALCLEVYYRYDRVLGPR